MTIQVHIDGLPYLVLFSGTIDIGPMNSAGDIAIRKVSDDAILWGVELDQKSIEESHAFVQAIFDRERQLRESFERHLNALVKENGS